LKVRSKKAKAKRRLRYWKKMSREKEVINQQGRKHRSSLYSLKM
jgi:hypothetical protein